MANMVSFLRTSQDHMADMMPSGPDGPDVGPELCITLTDRIMEALDLDTDVERGDMLHMMIMVQVTDIHKDASGCRIGCAIIGGKIEDESNETMNDEDEEEDE